MATKVNVKFVVALAVALVALSGVIAWVAFEKLTTSGEEYEAKGDLLVAEGNYDEAADMYRRAVGHDQTNIVWLTKWRDTILKVVPETQVEYITYYQRYYLGILNTLAVLQPSDVNAQRAYLQPYYDQLLATSANAEAWQGLIDNFEQMYSRLPQESAEAQALRRFRGLARLHRMNQIEERDADRQSALEDLQAALEADPQDLDAMAGMIQWRFSEWKRAIRLRRTQTAEQLWQQLGEEIAGAKERFPGEPRILLMEIQIAVERVLQLEEDPGRRVRMVQQMKGTEDPLLEALRAADPATIHPGVLMNAYQSLKPLRPATYAADMLDVIESASEAQPDRADLMLLHARVLRDLDRHEEAVARLDAVVKMPDQPVSLDGLMLVSLHRTTAIYEQAESILDIYAKERDAERRKELLAQAKSYRKQLVERVTGGENSSIAMMVDGRIALAENRPTDAVERLTALDERVGGRDAEVIQLLGQALLDGNLLGAARTQFERLIEINPGDVRSIFMLAEIERRLRNLDGAVERLEQILAIAPDFTEAKMQLRAINAERGLIENVDATDANPVRVALIRWQALMNQDPPQADEALEVLTEARAQYGDDPSIFNALIIHFSQEGQADRAMALAHEAAELYPGNKIFSDWVVRLQMASGDNSLEDRLALIDTMDYPEVERMIAKITLLQQSGRDAEAEAMVEQASAIAPDHPALIEHRFSRALANEDFTAARSIASTAARLNLDSVDGQLFQARIEFAQEENQKALATLRQVIDRIPFDPMALRMLGQTYLRLGRTGDAIDALRQAFQNKPDGLLVARLYVQTLSQLQRHDEALQVVKQARKFNAADRVLTEQWLSLEAAAGDRSLALMERRKRHQSDSGDLMNGVALARMLMEDGEWSESKGIIDDMIASNSTTADLARLAADWHGRQGDVEAGADVLRAFQREHDNGQNRLLVAQYYMTLEQEDAAIEALNQAIARNDKETRSIAQLMLADLHFQKRDFEQALPLYKAAIDAGADNAAGDVGRRYAEALLQLGRHEEAVRTLQALTGPARQHPRTNILLAKTAAAQGDRRGAQTFLDAAVASAPNDPEVFFERASFNASDPTQLQDVLEDLNQAIRLAPGAGAARQLKAQVLTQNGRQAEAVRELQAAINANPDSRELRMILINLLHRMNQTDAAIAQATEAAKRFPNEARWRVTIGDFHARAGRWNDAAREYKTAYDIEPSPTHAIRLGQAYLEATPPRLNEILSMFDENDPENQPHLSTFFLLESQAHLKLNNLQRAREMAARSFEAARTPADLRDWFTGVAALFPNTKETLDFVRSLTPVKELQPLYVVLVSRLEATDFARHESVIAELERVERDAMDPLTRADLYRLLGGLLYYKNEYERATAVYRKAIQILPDDLEFNNNLAYLLARHLNNAQEALGPAEKAAQLAPVDPDVLDTLGWVYFQLGRLSQAQATLNRAIENAREPAQRVPAYIHLAETLHAQNESARARRHIDAAGELLSKSPALKQQFGEQFEAVMKKLNPTE